MSKTLIVYYSRKGENYWNGSIKTLSKGNTEIVAEMIADLTGGDLFEVFADRMDRQVTARLISKPFPAAGDFDVH